MAERKVKRVLVIVDYGENDPQSGEVFDITALALETSAKSELNHSSITLRVTASRDYATRATEENRTPMETEIHWCASINFHSSANTGYLDDAINSAMPDSFATKDMRKKLKRIHARSEKLQNDIQVQRLFDASKIRSTHPIARVTNPALREIQDTQIA